MRSLNALTRLLLLTAAFAVSVSPALAWHDNTHMAVAKAAGYEHWYNATGADQAKLKSGAERLNHYYNLPPGTVVDAELVLAQKPLYNRIDDSMGHLYGAILGALEDYRHTKKVGKYAEYHLAFAAHYIADLSQPLHDLPYDAFNRKYHKAFDGIVEDEMMERLDRIQARMYPIDLGENPWEEGLPQEIARIANLSRALGMKVRKENRMITRDEAYVQLGHSASLFRAVLKALDESGTRVQVPPVKEDGEK